MTDQNDIGPEIIRRLTHLNDALEENDRLRGEIASLREAIRRLADQDATLSAQGCNVTVEMEALTPEECEAIAYVELTLRCEQHPVCQKHTKTLRELLTRINWNLK